MSRGVNPVPPVVRMRLICGGVCSSPYGGEDEASVQVLIRDWMASVESGTMAVMGGSQFSVPACSKTEVRMAAVLSVVGSRDAVSEMMRMADWRAGRDIFVEAQRCDEIDGDVSGIENGRASE